MPPIRHVIFDFDGTCTQIPPIYRAYLDEYRAGFASSIAPVTPEEWLAAEKEVNQNSPGGGWTVGGTPSAPMAADPYILSDEVSKLLCRQRNISPPASSGLFNQAYTNHQAPWRPEVREVLTQLHSRGIQSHFVSNSSSQTIANRLDDLLVGEPAVRSAIKIASGAGKFLIQELPWDGSVAIDAGMRSKFEALPAADTEIKLPFGRPVYLRRGAYFQSVCRTLETVDAMESTLVCGDVWELDLAMPAQMGMRVHLITRAAPFDTYPYEIEKIVKLGSQASKGDDLSSILERCDKENKDAK